MMIFNAISIPFNQIIFNQINASSDEYLNSCLTELISKMEIQKEYKNYLILLIRCMCGKKEAWGKLIDELFPQLKFEDSYSNFINNIVLKNLEKKDNISWE